MTDKTGKDYNIRAHEVRPDDVLPKDMDPVAYFYGTHLAVVGPDVKDWARMHLPGEVHPVLIAEVITRLFTERGDQLRFPPVLVTIPGAALLIGSILSAFEDSGLGPRLGAELDQVKAGWRTAIANPDPDLLP